MNKTYLNSPQPSPTKFPKLSASFQTDLHLGSLPESFILQLHQNFPEYQLFSLHEWNVTRKNNPKQWVLYLALGCNVLLRCSLTYLPSLVLCVSIQYTAADCG